jgi:hypothetical protein
MALCVAPVAWGSDIIGVQPAALDQPSINALISDTLGGAPLTAEDGGITYFNIEAYYDTGASGILLSNETAEGLGLEHSTYNGQEVVYQDVGVAGTSDFFVSDPVYLNLAPYVPNADIDNLSSYSTVYTQSFGPVRTEIGPTIPPIDPNLQNLDVIGTPAMANKVIVMDPSPVDRVVLGQTDDLNDIRMHTFVYDPGTQFHSGTTHDDPGIPLTNRHIQLSFASFDQFTNVIPGGAPGPTLANNPFIGPNPVAALNGDNTDTTPPLTLSYGSHSTDGSFLLDTGAAASMISTAEAAKLGIIYTPGTEGTDDPTLDGVPLGDQFQLTIGGIGGTTKVAGFFLDSLDVPTKEGDILHYVGAPVLVNDITVLDPTTDQTLTLDGIFGMNYLVGSVYLIEDPTFPILFNPTVSPYNWVVFDPVNHVLGVDLKVPEPSTALLLAAPLMFVLGRRRRV